MKQIVYCMRFTGQAGPAEEGSSDVLKAATSAPSSTVTSVVGTDGLSGSIEPVAGGETAFESEVRFTSEMAFLESGSITFGAGNSLRFSTVGSGHIGPSPESGLMHGSVMWQVDSGEGQFAGASGLITSNFTVDAAGAVTDHHFGLIFVK
jgi:hypothetical protein